MMFISPTVKQKKIAELKLTDIRVIYYTPSIKICSEPLCFHFATFLKI